MKIGIFGGSFNPVHKGHERALFVFASEAGLDKVLIIPSFSPPHKSIPTLWASFEDRCKMAELAISDIPNAEICTVEKTLFEKSGKKSYTKVTLEHLKNQYDGEYYLYVGTDMFTTLHSWYECRYLFDNTVIAVMTRDGNKEIINEYKKRYEKDFNAKIVVLQDRHVDVSSTEIREIIDNGGEPLLVSRAVSEYIEKNRLYKKAPEHSEIYTVLKGSLKEKRLLHTLSVEKETRYLASLLCPEFEDELSKAALLHDCTKYLTQEEHLAMLEGEEGYDPNAPETLHADSGAVYARNAGIPMWRAIKYHTTGKPDMSLFEMIVFVADYIEEGRTHESCIIERERLHTALNGTERDGRLGELQLSVYRILDATVKYLQSKQVYIHPLTLDALEYYKALRGEK